MFWEGAAGSTWMQKGGKPMGMNLVVLPSMRTPLLVAMAGLGLETPTVEQRVCVFPRKLGLMLGTCFEKGR